MMNRHPWVKPALVLVVFLVAFLPRAVYPVSRPPQWYPRSVMFIHSVTHGDWGETVYSEHPGVTTMWLSGLALRLAGVTPELRPDGPYVDPASLTALRSAIGVLPLASVIAALIVLLYLSLTRLFDRTAALSAALLVALDPFFLANSKVLHVDGLLAAFMATSALALLVYVNGVSERRYRWVVLSGALAGLALLTKSPALFLLPYAALCLAVSVLADLWQGVRQGVRQGLLTAACGSRVLAGLIWLAVLALVYCALFPAMWVHPLATLKTVYGQASLRINWPHPNPIYFLGRAFIGDPGPTYYLYTWAYKVTSLVSVFALIALLYATFGKTRPRHRRIAVGLVFAFVLFFTLQMMLGAKKMPRYLLPAFPLMDILAGVGLVWWAKPFRSARSPDRSLVALALLLQAALILPRHPYYDTYFNELAGGARAGVAAISTQWQGEGLDMVARLLNKLPDAEHQTVGTHKAVLFRQYFVGQTVDVDEPADWHVFGVNNVLKGVGRPDYQTWELYRRRRPWHTVVFDDIPYVWVHRPATGPQNPIVFDFKPGIQLIGYDVAPAPYSPGQTLQLQLYWQALQPPIEDYTVFVHLLSLENGDGAGPLIAQQDNPPVRGTRPTSTWEPGVVVVDPYDLLIPQDTPSGEYVLAVGLYRWPDLSRLPVRSGEGDSFSGDRALLTTVHVERRDAPPGGISPTTWGAWVVTCSVLLSAAMGLKKREER